MELSKVSIYKPTDARTAYMHYGFIPAKNTPSFIQDIEPTTINPLVFTSIKGETWSDNMTPVSIVTGDPIYQK